MLLSPASRPPSVTWLNKLRADQELLHNSCGPTNHPQRLSYDPAVEEGLDSWLPKPHSSTSPPACPLPHCVITPQDPHLSIPHPTSHPPPIPPPPLCRGSVSLAVGCMSMDFPLEQMPFYRLCCCLWCLGCLTCHLLHSGCFLPFDSLTSRENEPSPDPHTVPTSHLAFLVANCKILTRIFVIVCVFQGFSSLIILHNRIK